MLHRFPLTITTGSRPLKTCHEMDDVSQIIGSESSLRRERFIFIVQQARWPASQPRGIGTRANRASSPSVPRLLQEALRFERADQVVPRQSMRDVDAVEAGNLSILAGADIRRSLRPVCARSRWSCDLRGKRRRLASLPEDQSRSFLRAQQWLEDKPFR
jgi:hypothetical protein